MSITTFSISDVARLLGISRSQAISELASWPHDGEGLAASFTADQVAEIKALMNAGPEEQAARQQLLADKRAELQAEDEPNH